jgi:DNA-directed RNA polymerase subunit RPC12/RpoP
MKSSGVCPKCSGRELFVVSPVRESRGDDDPIPVVTTRVRGHMVPLTGGTHDLYVCATCGFEEWYARGANELLDRLSAVPEAGVRRISGGGPYR